MKKLGLLVMPLMAVSLLASCGGSTPKVDNSYLVDFDGADCTATRGGVNFNSDNIEANTKVTLEIAPKAGSEYHFELNDSITFLVNGEASDDYTYTKVTGTDKYSLVFTVTGKTEIYASTTEYCWLTYVSDPAKKAEKVKRGATLEGHLDPLDVGQEYDFMGWFYNETFTQICKPSQKIYEDTTIYGCVAPSKYNDPLTFTCVDDGSDEATLRFLAYNDFEDIKTFTRNLKYKITTAEGVEGEWTPINGADDDGNFDITFPEGEDNVYVNILKEGDTLNKDDKIQFAGNNNSFCYTDIEAHSTFLLSFETGGSSSNDRFNVSGNIMSLLSSNGFGALTDIPEVGCFTALFSGSWVTSSSNNCNIVNAKDLLLPATKLTIQCYESMFEDNPYLKEAPNELPATQLADDCYYWMFNECTELINGPTILAREGAPCCFGCMFNECTKLQNLTVAFGTSESDEWMSGDNPTFIWLNNAGTSAATTPVFKWKGPETITSWERDADHVPSNWQIKHYND